MRNSVFNIDVKRPPKTVLTTDCAVRSGSVRDAPTLPSQKYVWVAPGLSTSSTRRPSTRGAACTAGAAASALGSDPNAATRRAVTSCGSKSPTTAMIRRSPRNWSR